MLRRVDACGGLTTNVTSVCQLLADPFSLSTGRTFSSPSTDATVGWALVSGPKWLANFTCASSERMLASRNTRALCSLSAARISATVSAERSPLRSRPRISAPMREPSLENSSFVSVMTVIVLFLTSCCGLLWIGRLTLWGRYFEPVRSPLNSLVYRLLASRRDLMMPADFRYSSQRVKSWSLISPLAGTPTLFQYC